MSMFKRKMHEVPRLNTSSLPDLIFVVLFFFMIVTHMRKVMVKVEFQKPQGTELTRLTKKSAVSYIYIGKASKGKETCIQLNDKLVTPPEIMDYIVAERNRMSPEDRQQMMVSINADRHTKMGVITDVKQALRQVKVTRINYSAVEKEK